MNKNCRKVGQETLFLIYTLKRIKLTNLSSEYRGMNMSKIPWLDCIGEGGGGGDSSLSIVPNVIAQPPSFHAMTEIDFLILIRENFLDYKTLATCRRVCRNWNEMLGGIFFGKSKLSLLYEVDPYRPHLVAIPTRKFRIPEMQMAEVQPAPLPFWALRGWNPFYTAHIPPPEPEPVVELEPSFAEWLRRGDGQMITSIEFQPQYKKTFPIHILLHLLDCCPNLQNITFGTPAFTGTVPRTYSFPTIRSLTLSFGILPNKWGFHGTEKEVQFSLILEILKFIPNLTSLKVCMINLPMPFYLKLFEACNEAGFLKSLSEINLWKDDVHFETFDYLSKIPFQNLKKVKLGWIDKVGLGNFLTNVSHCLEELWIEAGAVWTDNNPDIPRPSLFPLRPRCTFHCLSIMQKLKSFTYHSWTSDESGTIDFIKKLPNLQSLVLHIKRTNLFQPLDEEAVEQLFPSINTHPGYFQYVNLRHLELKHAPVKLESMRIICQMFPELLSLHFYHNSEENLSYYFQELSTLAKLSSLKIVSTLEPSQLNAAFEDEFHNLKALKRMEFMYNKGMYPTRERIVLSGPAFLRGVLRAPLIKRVRLVNIVINPDELTAVMAGLNSQGVKLYTVDTPVRLETWENICARNNDYPVDYAVWPYCDESFDPWIIWDLADDEENW